MNLTRLQIACKSTVTAYIYFPNGTATGSWKPRKVARDGKILQLNQWMEPLDEHRKDLIVTGKLKGTFTLLSKPFVMINAILRALILILFHFETVFKYLELCQIFENAVSNT